MVERIYLDHNASTPVLPDVCRAVESALREHGANPSSVHAEGRSARHALERARAQVAALLGARPADLVFTSGGTEANAAGLWGLVRGAGGPGGVRVLTSAVEHPSLLAAAEWLGRLGARHVVLPVDGAGLLDREALAGELSRGGPCVVALQLANSETGVIQPVVEVAELVRAAGATLHCDAVQAAGRIDVIAAADRVDTMAVAGHKLGGPPGIGALVLRSGLEIEPLLPGNQEGRRRGGSENLPGAIGFGVACELAAARVGAWRTLAPLRDALEAALAGRVERVWGAGAPRLPGTCCLGLPAPLTGPEAVAALDLAGIAVSSGPACSSGVVRASEVLMAMGASRAEAQRSVRVSLGPGSCSGTVDRLVSAFGEVLARARGGVT